MAGTQPVDSAFTGGVLHLVPLDGTAVTSHQSYASVQDTPLTGTLPVSILIIISTVICIASLRKYVNLVPSLAGCMVRWKENINLEDSVPLSRSRDYIFYILAIPFCILASCSRMYCPELLSGLPPQLYFASVTGVFILYLCLRKSAFWIFRGRRASEKTYRYAAKSFRTFFIAAATTALATAGIMGIDDAGQDLTGKVLLYETGFFYVLFLVRKTQIFKNYCSLFTAILYLCALEFLPTGILVATAIVL